MADWPCFALVKQMGRVGWLLLSDLYFAMDLCFRWVKCGRRPVGGILPLFPPPSPPPCSLLPAPQPPSLLPSPTSPLPSPSSPLLSPHPRSPPAPLLVPQIPSPFPSPPPLSPAPLLVPQPPIPTLRPLSSFPSPPPHPAGELSLGPGLQDACLTESGQLQLWLTVGAF